MSWKALTTQPGLGQLFQAVAPELNSSQVVNRCLDGEPNDLRLIIRGLDSSNNSVPFSEAVRIMLSYDTDGTSLDAAPAAVYGYFISTLAAGAQTRYTFNGKDSANANIAWEAGFTGDFSIGEMVTMFLSGQIGNGGAAIDTGEDVEAICINQVSGYVLYDTGADWDAGTIVEVEIAVLSKTGSASKWE